MKNKLILYSVQASSRLYFRCNLEAANILLVRRKQFKTALTKVFFILGCEWNIFH